MLSIDGLVTGIDTQRIIDGLLNIQQRQIDQLSARRARVLGKQAAFTGVEGRLLSLRGALGRLTSSQTTVLANKIVTTSDEAVLQAAATDDAQAGTFRLRVESLASAHQIATGSFDSADAEIGQGSFGIRVGDGSMVSVTIDQDNDSLQGLANAINAADTDVTASIVNDGPGSFRLLLSSNKSGVENEITLDNQLTGGSDVTFDFDNPVEVAANSVVRFGSGSGAIRVESATNRVENVISGVTLNLNSADPDKEITLTVQQDIEGSKEAVSEFVSAYNDLVKYVNEQVSYNSELQAGGVLLGERSVTSIQSEIQLSLSSAIGGLNSNLNRLTAIGISVEDDGTLALDERRLEDVLAGRVDGVSAQDAVRLFSLGADSSNAGIEFVSGSSNTASGNVEVEITQVARAAVIEGTTPLAGTIEIDGTNNTFSLVIDGTTSSELSLAEGSYTAAELAIEIQSLINADSNLGSRDVTVSLNEGRLRIESNTIGSNSEVKLLSGNAWSALGLSGTEADNGQNVEGYFLVNGVQEEATGRGTLLFGKEGNESTADLQVRVNLEVGDLGDGSEATLSVTRGFASRLDALIGEMMESDGRVKTVNQRYTDTSESILQSIERLQARFDAERESLLAQFAALESSVGQLQTTGSYLASQLGGFSNVGI